MARVAVPVENVPVTGLEPAQTAASALGHTVVNNSGRTFIRVVNDNAADDVTVSITPSDDREGLARETLDIAVPATEARVISGLKGDLFEQFGTDKGMIYLDFAGGDVLTDVKLEAFTVA